MAAPEQLSVVLFTRFPRAGQAKTRLIPALGAEGAAELQRKMTRLAVARAWTFCAAAPGRRLVVAFDGGTEREMRSWLGPLNFVPQGEGDLGVRMSRAISGEFSRGADKVVVMGSDCPRLTEAGLEAAASALGSGEGLPPVSPNSSGSRSADVVFGPALDGGYYLVGLRAPAPALFSDMVWSTSDVLARSLARAEAAALSHTLLDPLPDVDEPADLADADAAMAVSRTVSVIVPAWNEAANLTRLLPLLAAGQPHQILVADGGSTDETVSIARAAGATVIAAPKGRALQMNAAAVHATGEHVLFLHADTEPPAGYSGLIAETLAQAGTAAGAFRFRLREPVFGGSLIECGVALRCALRQLPYGDQGLFLRRSLFRALGGFPELPILEDLELVLRLRHLGQITITQETALTSARRWQQGGLFRTFLRHQYILAAHALGVAPERLVRARSRSRRG